MYYEEKVIEGKLCCRGTPDGEWIEMSKVALTSIITALRDENAGLRTQLECIAS